MPSLRACLILLWALAAHASAQTAPADVRVDRAPTPNSVDDCRIAASGDSIYVAWEDRRNTQRTIGDIYFNASHDGGVTWFGSDVLVSGIPSAPTLSAVDQEIAAEGDNVFVTWRATNGAIFCNSSRDGGRTWLTGPIQLTAFGVSAEKPDVVIDNGVAYVIWTGNYPFGAISHAFISRSTNLGFSWSAPIQLDSAAIGQRQTAQLAVEGSSIYVAWSDFRSGDGDIYCNYSHDSGLTWQPADVRLDTDPAGVSHSWSPRIAATGSSVHVAWLDFRGSVTAPVPQSVYCNSSLDGGTTWQSSDIRVDTGPNEVAYAASARIAATGSSVCVAWVDSPTGTSTDVSGIYANFSSDGGVTFQPAATRINEMGSYGTDLQLAASGPLVSAVWEGNTIPGNGNSNLYHNHSIDGGSTWQNADAHLQSTPVDSAFAYVSDVCVSGSDVYTVWADRRTPGSEEVRFNIPFGALAHGIGTAGSGGLTPSLTHGGGSLPSQLMSLDVADGLGAATGAVMIGFGPSSRVSLPRFGGTLLVAPTTTIPITLGGAAGAAGAGSLQIQLGIPANSALRGLNVNFQTLIIDSGASGGISMTNAIHVWIG